MTHQQLERAAVAAHEAGETWHGFYGEHGDAIGAAVPDWYERGRFVHRLVGLLTAGNLDGAAPIDAGFNVPLAFEIDGSTPPVPVYPATDDSTAARCLWQPQGARA